MFLPNLFKVLIYRFKYKFDDNVVYCNMSALFVNKRHFYSIYLFRNTYIISVYVDDEISLSLIDKYPNYIKYNDPYRYCPIIERKSLYDMCQI